MHLLQGFAVPPEVAKRRLEDTSFLERDAFYRRFHWLSDRRRDGSASEDREVAQLWTSFVSDSTHLQSEPSTDRAARLLQEAALLCDDLDQAASEHEAVSLRMQGPLKIRILIKLFATVSTGAAVYTGASCAALPGTRNSADPARFQEQSSSVVPFHQRQHSRPLAAIDNMICTIAYTIPV